MSAATAQNQTKRFTTHQIVLVGVMGAIVFVSNYLSITIPLAVGDPTRIHVANAFCLLAGMVLGPVSGGLAAGIGSMLYDFTMPAYIASSPFTFAFKFLMAFVAGKIANSGGLKAANLRRNLVACLAGQITYLVLYLGKKFVSGILVGNAVSTVLAACAVALGTSLLNAAVSIVVALILAPVFRKVVALAGRS